MAIQTSNLGYPRIGLQRGGKNMEAFGPIKSMKNNF